MPADFAQDFAEVQEIPWAQVTQASAFPAAQMMKYPIFAPLVQLLAASLPLLFP